MSADSSSDESPHELTRSQTYDVHSQIYDPQAQVKCWECGKQTQNLSSLMDHYKSHNIKATCHVCQVTFRRLVSLASHMENAHSPPVCRVCERTFSSIWELNKHAEMHYAKSFKDASPLNSVGTPDSNDLSDEVTVQQKCPLSWGETSEITPEERCETSEQGVEFVVGDDDDDDDTDDRGSSSESEGDAKTCNKSENSNLDDSDSSSSDSYSSDSSDSSKPSKATPASSRKTIVCKACGRGPFKSIKLHLRHCKGSKKKQHRCSICKLIFQSELSLRRHLIYLFSCQVCSQVFSHQSLWDTHSCPKSSNSPLISFCSEAMPKACKICKCFFTSDKTLSAHIDAVHMSVVSTKVCIVTDLSLLNNPKVSAGNVNTGERAVSQAFNGKLRAGQTYAGSMSVPLKPSLSSSCSQPETPPVPICLISAAAPVKPEPVDVPVTPTNQPPIPHPQCDLQSDTTPAAPVSKSSPSASILALFENDSQDRALRQRAATWRSKAPHPCRQCGVALRQPSLVIGHRYLHRGKRTHRCQCGRVFKHQLHLLRHCVQHAEAVSYICVSCGNTFIGAKLLARHVVGKSPKQACRKGKRKCRMAFTCECGLRFYRPSAYIWHQLQNRTKK